MLVRLSDPGYQTELIVFLRNSGLSQVRPVGGDLRVAGVRRKQLVRILDTWRSLHPKLSTEVIPDGT